MNKPYLVLLSAMLFVFCTDHTVGIPDLIYPINGEQVDLPLTFIWSSADNSTGYRIEVDTFLAFSSPLISVDASDTTYTIVSLSSGVYYWRAAAYDEDNRIGEFTYPHNFEVIAGAAPTELSITATSDGLSVILSWIEPITGQPDNYVIYFREVNTTTWVFVATISGNVLNFTHSPSDMTGDYYVAAVFSDIEYGSDIISTIPIHTAEMTIHELDGSSNAGYGWDIARFFTGATYFMGNSANADSVDLYVTNFTDDPIGGPWPIPWSIASPDLAPNDPGGSYVPATNWHQNRFSDPISNPQAALPEYGATTYFNYTEGIETDPTHIAVYVSANAYYALVRFSSINPTQGTIQIESWIQSISGLRLIAH